MKHKSQRHTVQNTKDILYGQEILCDLYLNVCFPFYQDWLKETYREAVWGLGFCYREQVSPECTTLSRQNVRLSLPLLPDNSEYMKFF